MQFRIFLRLIIAWNVLTFSGHWMRQFIDNEQFVFSNGHIQSFHADGILDIFFYLTCLDHLVLVPAFFILIQAILQWNKQTP
jgi:hypothetical protein